jgi:hypothetical protein
MVAMMALIWLPAVAGASTYTFTPTPTNLWNLDHNEAYTWGIDSTKLPSNEVITGATLSFDQIYNWQIEPNTLYIHLLNNPSAGSTGHWDYRPGDYFSGQGVLIDTYSDSDGPNSKIDLTYSFTADQISALTTYAQNGTFGFGFDPDCHYYNGGIKFEVTTAPAPEPATLLLLGSGLLGLVGVRRRAKRATA